jgi:hypothetical protein
MVDMDNNKRKIKSLLLLFSFMAWHSLTYSSIALANNIAENAVGIMGSFIAILIVALIYFLPSVIASARDRKNGCAIFALNLLGGWTFIGWLVALIWAISEE